MAPATRHGVIARISRGAVSLRSFHLRASGYAKSGSRATTTFGFMASERAAQSHSPRESHLALACDPGASVFKSRSKHTQAQMPKAQFIGSMLTHWLMPKISGLEKTRARPAPSASLPAILSAPSAERRRQRRLRIRPDLRDRQVASRRSSRPRCFGRAAARAPCSPACRKPDFGMQRIPALALEDLRRLGRLGLAIVVASRTAACSTRLEARKLMSPPTASQPLTSGP